MTKDEQIERLQAELTNRDRKIEVMEAEIDALRAGLNELRRRSQEQREELTRLLAELVAARNALSLMRPIEH